MAKGWKNNLSFKIVAFVLAIVLWLYLKVTKG